MFYLAERYECIDLCPFTCRNFIMFTSSKLRLSLAFYFFSASSRIFTILKFIFWNPRFHYVWNGCLLVWPESVRVPRMVLGSSEKRTESEKEEEAEQKHRQQASYSREPPGRASPFGYAAASSLRFSVIQRRPFLRDIFPCALSLCLCLSLYFGAVYSSLHLEEAWNSQ